MTFQVDTVFVWVSDVEESVGWYRQFGIDPGARYGGWQTMLVDGETHFALHQGSRPKGRSTGAIAFRVDDLEAEIRRLGGIAIHPVEDEITDAGVARFTTFHDPDRNDVQLLERT